ncbi:17408_t:CDS:2, partial [Funneliformis geosporum]
LPDLLRDIATAIDRVEIYVDGDRSFDPKNTLNGIRITLATILLPALYTHLPPDLRSNVKMYMAIRAGGGVNPTVNDFFQDLKKCWVERQVGVNTFTQTNV